MPFVSPARSRMTVLMLSPIEPRCTGMCGALATNAPPGSKMAQEKSRRSLMFTEAAVFSSTEPICSATDINRLLKISNSTGSTVAASPVSSTPARCAWRSRIKLSSRVSRARQPGSTTMVLVGSRITAGPGNHASAAKLSRR